MIQITLTVNAPSGQAIGTKEELAMYCERHGDTKVLKIEEIQPEQMRIGADNNYTRRTGGVRR